MSVFNPNNTEWQDGSYSLFLGQEPALYDSINKPHPKLFQLYKLQKSIDWDENEFNHEQSRMDLLSCPKTTYEIMVKNLAFQWELDSVASRAIAPLLAPFVTNSEVWASLMKQSEIEVLHALSYSEIVRQAIPDPNEVFKEVMYNEEMLRRAEKVVTVFNELQQYGAQYTLKQIPNALVSKQDIQKIILKGVVTLYCLERLQFMSSFAATFAIAEQGYFQSIGKTVQKIMQDELVHTMMDEEIINILLNKEGWGDVLEEIQGDVQEIVQDIVEQELSWNTYLFSEGRSIVGLNKTLLDEWVVWNAQVVYNALGLESDYPKVSKNPLPWMDNWMDLDKFQNAMQEADGNNYSLNVVKNDLDEDEVLEF